MLCKETIGSDNKVNEVGKGWSQKHMAHGKLVKINPGTVFDLIHPEY